MNVAVFLPGVRAMRLFRKRIIFDQAGKFNYELDRNEKLKTALKNLSLSQSVMGKEKYLSELLRLFREERLDLSIDAASAAAKDRPADEGKQG